MGSIITAGFGPTGSTSGSSGSGSATVLTSGPMSSTFEQPIASDRSYQISLFTTEGAPAAGFFSSDALSAVIWSGEDQAIAYQPSISWINPAQGLIQINVAAAGVATAGLTPGIYRIQASVFANAQTIVILDGAIKFTASPGAAAPLPVYCSFADLKVYAPWLDNLLDTRDELTGFAVERGRARQWLDDLIARSYRGGTASVFGNDPGGNWGGLWGSRRTEAYSPFIVAQLQANALIVRPAIVEAVATYALGIICRAQLGRSGASDYARLADSFLADAHNSAICLTAELDTNGDGIADIVIPLGTANTFWA